MRPLSELACSDVGVDLFATWRKKKDGRVSEAIETGIVSAFGPSALDVFKTVEDVPSSASGPSVDLRAGESSDGDVGQPSGEGGSSRKRKKRSRSRRRKEASPAGEDTTAFQPPSEAESGKSGKSARHKKKKKRSKSRARDRSRSPTPEVRCPPRSVVETPFSAIL